MKWSLILLLLFIGCAPDDRHITIETTRKIDFWDTQRKGANFFNQVETRARLDAGAGLGLEMIRLAPDKWAAADRDFLLGDADAYTGLNEQDFSRLRHILDEAAAANIKVILTMLSLPGARWRQHNEGQDDGRLWQDEYYQEQALSFWKDLASRLRGHPAIVAYDPLNEPHPAKTLAALEEPDSEAYATWWEQARGTTADLNRFNRRLVRTIRTVDPETPILLEAAAYSTPDAFRYLEPVADEAVLYSVHVYGPWNYVTKRVNRGRFAYPERMPVGWSGETESWSIERLKAIVEPVAAWSQRHQIPSHRIVVSEFGCAREVGGAARYLADWITIFNDHHWHWAFYSYREDTWNDMDYELGPTSTPIPVDTAGLWTEKPWTDNPLFDVLKREFRPANRPPQP